MEQVLEMVFKTGTGKSFRITLDAPRIDIDPVEVEAAMNLIISKDIFNVEGGLVAIEGANIITTEEEQIVFPE